MVMNGYAMILIRPPWDKGFSYVNSSWEGRSMDRLDVISVSGNHSRGTYGEIMIKNSGPMVTYALE
jgi:hypothetical protein